MTPRMKSCLILAGLCSLTTMLVGEREAQAGSTLAKNAITITGVYKPGTGEPPFDYIFQVFLNAPTVPGTNTFMKGDSFTVDGLPGVDTNSTQNAPFNPPTVEWSGGALNMVVTASPPASAPFESDFSWVFNGSNVYSVAEGDSPLFLGQFTVLSSFDFPTGVVPLPNGTLLTYTFTADGGGTGTFPIMNASVPEPSSVILLAVGAGVLPMFWLRGRRRRQERQAIR